MRVLVTRPEPDASQTAKRLLALGHEPTVAPLLRIIFAPPPVEIPEPAAIILTSRNGVRALARWPQTADWLNRPVFVTGLATADAARSVGFADVRTAAGNAADLADLVVSDIGKDGSSILYPAARDRSGGLLSELHANGYHVQIVEAYCAEMVMALDAPVREAIHSLAVNGVLIYSYRTAAAFRTLVDREGIADSVRQMAFFAISERVAESLRDLAAEIHVAKTPEEESLLALLPNTPR